MKQTTKNIKSEFHYPPELDFIFEATGVAILVEDIKRNIQLTNILFCHLFHLNAKPNSLLNTNSISLLNEISKNFDDPQKFETAFKDIPKKGDIVTNQLWKLANGKTILQDYSPLYKDNTLKGHIWVYKEYQNLQNENLIYSNFQLENALHFLPNEIAIYNTNLQIVYINKAYINNDEKRVWAKGKTLQQYFSYENLSQEIAQERERYIAKTFTSKTPISWQEKNIKDNAFYLRTCYPIIDSNKNVKSVIEHTIDITLQKKLEEKLQLSVEHFYKVVNSVNDVVLQTDGKLQLEFLNEHWHNLTGQNISELSGKSIFEVLEITHYELYQKAFSILNGDSKNHKGIIALEDKNKNIRQYQYNLQSGFSVEEGTQGILATLSDLTNEKMQEAQLLELIKKEKELNELKTTFVNMVSHELRTPLTVISSSAEILELMLQSGKGYNEVSVYTQQIIDEVEKMTAFMQDLLMISKIESGKIDINLSNINVVNFVEAVISKGFSPWKDGRKVTLIIKRKQQSANIDTSLLEHSLQNILQNAFKYSAGKLNPIVYVGFSKTYFTISVVDDGIGIPEKDIPKLFSSFFRASNTGNISGTGIGLMVAKYFTEQHKGNISFKSKANKGSIFTLKLPY